MSSVPVPGLYGLLRNPSFEEDGKRGIITLERKPQVSIESMALFGVQLRDVLSFRRKTAVRSSTTTMRLGWLARAAFVFFCISLIPKLLSLN